MENKLASRINSIQVSTTMQVAQRAEELRGKGIDIINLGVGEPDFFTPQNIKNAAHEAIDINCTKYTYNQGTDELRQSIAIKLKNDFNIDYKKEEILVSNGAKQSLFNAINVLVDVGDEVVFSSPYYVSYPAMVKLAGGSPVVIPTHEKNEFKITPEKLQNSITSKTKLFILCNPCNPTGTVYSRSELEALADIIEKQDIFVIVDEIYSALVYDNLKFTSFAEVAEKFKDRLILINGVSKTYSMTGWRIGYAAGNKQIIAAMNKFQSHSTSCANSIAQYAAFEAFTGSQASVEQMRVEFETRRNLLYIELLKNSLISCCNPRGAFYLFPNVAAFYGKSDGSQVIKNSTDFAIYLLENAKTAVVPGIAFGDDNFVRLSFSNTRENLLKGAEQISQALKKLLKLS